MFLGLKEEHHSVDAPVTLHWSSPVPMESPTATLSVYPTRPASLEEHRARWRFGSPPQFLDGFDFEHNQALLA